MEPNRALGKSETEGAVGKILMAVFASIFIGLSILFFAMLVFPTLSDAAKLAVIYVVCIAFVATGTLLLVFLNPNNKAFLSISLCGTGLMYIAFFVSHYAFDIASFGLILLMVLLWSAFCAIFAREYSFVYQIIGQLLVFGMLVTEALHYDKYKYDSSYAPEQAGRIVLVLAFYVLIMFLFFAVDGKREYHRNWIGFTAIAISPIPVLFFADLEYMVWEYAGIVSGTFLLLLTAAAMILSVTFFKLDEKKTVGFGIFNSIFTVSMIFALEILIPDGLRWLDILRHIILLAAVLVWLIVIEFRFHGRIAAGALIWQITAFVLLGGIAISFDDEIDLPVTVCMLATGALVYGFLRKRKSYKITGLVYACLFMLQLYVGNEISRAVFGMILLATAGILIFIRKDQYHTWYKVVFFFGVQWILLRDISDIFIRLLGDNLRLYTLADVLHLALTVGVTYLFAKLPVLQKNPVTWEKETALQIATGIYNVLLMFATVTSILVEDSMGYCIACIAIGAAAFAMNSWNLIRHETGSWPALYIGIKWLVLLLASAGGLGAERTGWSLIVLCYAFLCIAVGFVMQAKLYKNYQNVRILGLVLVCLSLLKLLIYDIYYSSNLIRAVGFFAAGMLCFAISFIYHLVEKKMKEGGRK